MFQVSEACLWFHGLLKWIATLRKAGSIYRGLVSNRLVLSCGVQTWDVEAAQNTLPSRTRCEMPFAAWFWLFACVFWCVYKFCCRFESLDWYMLSWMYEYMLCYWLIPFECFVLPLTASHWPPELTPPAMAALMARPQDLSMNFLVTGFRLGGIQMSFGYR